MTRGTGMALRGLVCCAALLGACQRAPAPAGAGAATAATVAKNQGMASDLDLADGADTEDARRGLVARATGRVLGPGGEVLWDLDQFAFVQGAAPPSVNPSLWRHARQDAVPGLYKVADGIWQVRGYDLANLTLVEGETGLIAVDTLTSRETAAAALAFARQHLGARPISAVVFTHSHVDHFGGALGVLPAGEARARAVTVAAPEGFLEEASSENVLLGPAMGRRATYMYGSRLPAAADGTGTVHLGLGRGVALGTIDVLPPTLIIRQTPQQATLDGVRFVFVNAPGSEAPAELAFYLPERRALCTGELAVQTMHNLYTLRGAKVRDALKWAGYLDDLRRRFPDAEVLFATHLWPVWGAPRVAGMLSAHADVYRYLHDQTVRLINLGKRPDEIAETLTLPPALRKNLGVRGYYGAVKHNVRGVYQQYQGWFDGDPARLDPLPRAEASRRYLLLAGGAEKLRRAAQEAFDGGDYRWAAELLDHALAAEPKDGAARALLARSYEQLGYQAESASWRGFYLTAAYELRQGPPARGLPRTALLGLLAFTPVEQFLDAMAANLNGPAAEGMVLTVNLVFSDTGEAHVLHLERSVLHHRVGPPDAAAQATLTVTKPFFLRMMTGSAGAKDLLFGAETKIDGSKVDLARLFALFAQPEGNFAVVPPP